MTFKKPSSSVLDEGSLVVVTGVNGFVASNIADQLISVGYNVRGTTRDVARDSWMKDFFAKKYGKEGVLELVEVKDLTRKDAFEEVVKDAAGFIHTANDPGFGASDPLKAIANVKTAALSALHSCAASPTMKRFVFTSSISNTISPKPISSEVITSASWNEAIIEAIAENDFSNPLNVYGAGKIQAEKAILEWVDSKPDSKLQVNTVVMAHALGKPLSVEKQGYRSSYKMIKDLWEGDVAFCEMLSPYQFVDISDCAILHALALIHPDVVGERVFAVGGPWSTNAILGILRKLVPGREFVGDVSNNGVDETDYAGKETAEGLLREAGFTRWTPLKDSVRRNVEDFM